MRSRLLLAFSIVAVCLAGTARAGIITYDFAGTGQLCVWSTPSCTGGNAFTGSITLDVDPSAPQQFFDDPFGNLQEGYSDAGWVTAQFEVQWAGGSYVSAPVPGEGSLPFSHRETTIVDDDGDGLTVGGDQIIVEYQSSNDDLTRENAATFNVFWSDWNTLTSVTFPEPIDFTGAITQIGFADFTNTWMYDNVNPYLAHTGGFSGNFLLSSISARPVQSVPEPSTLALFLIGFAGLGLVRRSSSAS